MQFPGLNVKNPNAALREVLANQQIGKVTTFVLDSSGLLNILFTQQHVTPNKFSAVFWVEEVVYGIFQQCRGVCPGIVILYGLFKHPQ
ncbi:hypothetical protein HGH93_09305 [Chitinophaga polysaccharea]|uniref:hypothetical protein n=1 Tax=Chitinophaga TaxID=79328 RepID=UPI00145F1301|nr:MULTISPECIES: hypothetical protein [Chitinophaga]NLR58294.1 hypothetical protein [Chitinophaga polysaccharea]NLU90820.1 hypothetical protein [Chitinophaga sp. Ak27]